MTNEGVPLHWLTCGECLRVTVDRDLPASLAREVSLTVKNWTAASGDGLCFRLDERPTTPDPTERNRIHLRNAGADLPPNVTQLTSLTFTLAAGDLLSADVQVSEAAGRRGLHYGFGQALGLRSSVDRLRSVMIPAGDGLEFPGEADIASLTAMYGRTPWCNPKP